jgi:hypothetical protein
MMAVIGRSEGFEDSRGLKDSRISSHRRTDLCEGGNMAQRRVVEWKRKKRWNVIGKARFVGMDQSDVSM